MNQQPPESPHIRNRDTLDVHSIFLTIQGEGPFAGQRAVFIRLAGCNLQCPLCDTDYTAGRTKMHISDLICKVYDLLQPAPHLRLRTLVVITGGEPFRQDITELCELLTALGYSVQIETNGTLPPPSHKFEELCKTDILRAGGVFIVCSPKTGRVNPRLRPLIGAYKYVLSADDVGDSDGLPMQVLDHSVSSSGVARPGKFAGPVYLQPADLKDDVLNADNINAVLRSCLKHGYILQLQIHKLIGAE